MSQASRRWSGETLKHSKGIANSSTLTTSMPNGQFALRFNGSAWLGVHRKLMKVCLRCWYEVSVLHSLYVISRVRCLVMSSPFAVPPKGDFF